MTDIYKNYTYRILPKSSASPTLLIINSAVTPPQILKIWLAEDQSSAAKSLDYELFVYENKIMPNLKKYPSLPFLPYVGCCETTATVSDLIKICNITNKQAIYNISLAFFIFKSNPSIQFSYTEDDFEKYSSNHTIPKNLTDVVENLKIKSIILPFKNFTPVNEIWFSGSTELVVHYMRSLIHGIFLMYNNFIVHNDLHAGNVMITSDEKLLIYDWDRAYINKKENPLLDDQKCSTGKCGSNSQCNIYNQDGYAIDLYKSLFYMLENREKIKDSQVVLENVFNMVNRQNNPYLVKSVIKTLTRSEFFSKDNCTFLQYPDEEMQIVQHLFGTINEIAAKAGVNDPSFEIGGAPVPKDLSNLIGQLSVKFAKKPSSTSSGWSFGGDTLIHNTITAPDKPVSELNKINENMQEILEIYNNSNRNIYDIIKMRELALSVFLGSPIKTKQTPVKQKGKLHEKNIAEIILLNDLKKYGNSTKINISQMK